MTGILRSPIATLALAGCLSAFLPADGPAQHPAPAPQSLEAVPTTPQAPGEWWTRSHLVDYGLVLGGALGYVTGRSLSPRSDPLWGPAYDPEDPSAVFEKPGVDRRFRSPGGEVTVPRSWIHWMIAGGGVFVTGMEGARFARGDGSLHRVHETAVGYLETVAITAAATALTKPFVGRLRPDFGDRARRYHCHRNPEGMEEACGDDVALLSEDPEEADALLDDGRRSFPSGHASHSFNLLGYTALVVGGRYVWGEGAAGRGRAVGVAGQAAMLGTASWMSWTRISDDRHHASDVVVGTLVGLGIANLSYWRRFNRHGAPRGAAPASEGMAVRPWITPEGAGLALLLRH